MKKITYILSLLILMFSINVNASSFSISVGSTSIQKGGSTTLKISGSDVIGRFNISVNNSNCSISSGSVWVENNTQSIKVTTKYAGSCKVTVSASDISNGKGSKLSLGSKSTTINIYNPRAASTNNNLGGLSIDGIDISPAFDPNVTEYTAVVPALTEVVKVNGSVQDRYASISGIGNISVEDGTNNITVTVKAENGATKSYHIKVTVLELSPIIVSSGDFTYSVVRKAKELPSKNDYYTDSVIKIKEDEVPSYYNEKLDYTLVGLKDGNGNIELFKYDNGRYLKYNEILFGNLYIEVLDEELVNYTKSEFTYGDQVITSYQSNNTDLLTNKEVLGDLIDDNYYLFYGVNIETGEKNLYQFDKREQTIQIFNTKALLDIKTNADKYYYGIVIAICVIIVLIILLIITNVRKNNKIKRLKRETRLELVDKEEVLNKKEIKELEKEDKEKAEQIEKTKEKFEEALVSEDFDDTKEEVVEPKEEKVKKTKKSKKNSK